MKLFASLSIFACVALLTLMNVGFSSCSKDADTIIVRDTITIRDTVSVDTLTTEMFTSTYWKIQEIRFVIGNEKYYYLRGGNANTAYFDNEKIKFNADFSGTYIGGNDEQVPLTWYWANQAHTSVVYVLHAAYGNTTITWEHMMYKNGGIRYGEYYTSGFNNSQAEGIRIPLNSQNVKLGL